MLQITRCAADAASEPASAAPDGFTPLSRARPKRSGAREFDMLWELEGLYANEWAGRMLSAWMVELNKEWNDGDGEG